MLMRILVAAGIVVVLVFGLLTWRQYATHAEPSGTPEASATEDGSTLASPDAAAPGGPVPPLDVDAVGVDWVVPRSWLQQISGGMRVLYERAEILSRLLR